MARMCFSSPAPAAASALRPQDLRRARGYDVGVTYKTDAKSAADVVAAVKAKGRKAVAIAADMGREADVERMFKEADALGRLTHFVYNAGIPGRGGTAGERGLRHDARGDRGQRARRAVVDAARHPPHVEEARRSGRLDRAAVVGRSRHRRPQRICLVRRLQGRGRVDHLRPEQGACGRRHPGQLRVARARARPASTPTPARRTSSPASRR